MVYNKNRFAELYDAVKFLLEHGDECREFGVNAYRTIVDEWNADVAACRFIRLANNLKEQRETEFCVGPCSKA